MVVKKLKAMPYAQAHVEIMPDGEINLFSYETLVVSVDPNGFCQINGLYSMTTRRHVSKFAEEYLKPLNYYDLKKAYEGDYVINYQTGEIIPWLEYVNDGEG